MPAPKGVPDDRTAKTAFKKLRGYQQFKARQLRGMTEEQYNVDADLTTIEIWAADEQDTGQAWAQQREKTANEDVAEGLKWDMRVQADDKAAAAEAQARAEMDVDQVKADMMKVLDDYEAALADQAKTEQESNAQQPWAKDKLEQVKKEHAAARKTIDEKLEPTLDRAAERSAQRRRRNKTIAKDMGKRRDDAQAWKAEYADQPEKYPAGQREEVRQALESLASWTKQTRVVLDPLGPSAKMHVENLTLVEEWANEQAGRLDVATPEAKVEAKEAGRVGAEHARETKAKIEDYTVRAEAEASEARETFNRWTLHNNKLAIQWNKSGTPAQKAWAKKWFETWKA